MVKKKGQRSSLSSSCVCDCELQPPRLPFLPLNHRLNLLSVICPKIRVSFPRIYVVRKIPKPADLWLPLRARVSSLSIHQGVFVYHSLPPCSYSFPLLACLCRIFLRWSGRCGNGSVICILDFFLWACVIVV